MQIIDPDDEWAMVVGVPCYAYRAQLFWLLDNSPVGEVLAREAKHLLATPRDDGQLGFFVAGPEFVAKLIAQGEPVRYEPD